MEIQREIDKERERDSNTNTRTEYKRDNDNSKGNKGGYDMEERECQHKFESRIHFKERMQGDFNCLQTIFGHL